MESESHKLVHCMVTNKRNESSFRWVELASFKLWRYMMSTKHEIHVDQARPCLWMSQNYYQQREHMLAHSGEIFNVDYIMLSIFNETNGFMEHITRYADKEDTEHVKKVLLSHVSDTVKNSKGLDIEVHTGVCIIQRGEAGALHLGLENNH